MEEKEFVHNPRFKTRGTYHFKRQPSHKFQYVGLLFND